MNMFKQKLKARWEILTVHSPIKLRNQVVHVMQSARLTVQAASQSASPKRQSLSSIHDLTDPKEADSLLPLQSPTSMYHNFDIPHSSFRRTFGQISGLPSTLTLSTTV